MQNDYKITHKDGIWVSLPRETKIVKQVSDCILKNNFKSKVKDNSNYGYPYVFNRGDELLNCRFVDSVFLGHPESWNQSKFVITDNFPLKPVAGKLISVLPEFWGIWHFDPVYINRPATHAYNCFMNRARGDRSCVFYELIKRNILDQGIVSYNVTQEELEQQFYSSDLVRYTSEHALAQTLVPYNTLTNSIEQSTVDSKVGLILETFTSDDHIVFSEKIFRSMQLPRPWLLYCSPGSVMLLRNYGFDVLDDYVNHSYDHQANHGQRLSSILNQLETFVNKTYNDQDYTRFDQAAAHNRELLKKFLKLWPERLDNILTEISKL